MAPSTMDRDSEEKLRMLRELMDEEGVRCLWISQVPYFQWLTGGGRNFVGYNVETGNAHVFVDSTEAVIVTTNVEEERIRSEECPGFEVVEYDWRDGSDGMTEKIVELAEQRPVDRDVERLSEDLDELSAMLTEAGIEEYRKLGADCGAVLELVAHTLTRGITEYAVAARIAAALLARGIDPVTLLVGFDKRSEKFRHPLPTHNKLENVAILGVVGRRFGLMASLSRMVCLGPVPETLRKKHNACVRIDATMMLTAEPGKSAEDAYRIAEETYDEVGFREEVLHHHQGGATGYKARYWKAMPGLTDRLIEPGRCYAWNPTICGVKSEDTILWPTGGGAPEVLTGSKKWPMIDVMIQDGRSIKRPDILELPANGSNAGTELVPVGPSRSSSSCQTCWVQ